MSPLLGPVPKLGDNFRPRIEGGYLKEGRLDLNIPPWGIQVAQNIGQQIRCILDHLRVPREIQVCVLLQIKCRLVIRDRREEVDTEHVHVHYTRQSSPITGSEVLKA